MKVATLSLIGGAHGRNEDSLWTREGLGLFVVADGIGGSDTGAAASRLAVDTCEEVLQRKPLLVGDPRAWIDEILNEANRAVFRLARGREASHGSTILMVGLRGAKAHFGWVGDSRLYRLRGRSLEQLSRDHSRFQELVARGVVDEGRVDPALKKGALTRCLGLREELAYDEGEVDLAPGDRLLLCTDGVSDAVEPGVLAELMRSGEPAAAVAAIERAVNDGGNRDDATCVLVEVDAADLAETPPPDADEVLRCLTSLMPSQPRDADRPAEEARVGMVDFFKGLARAPIKRIALEVALLGVFLGVGLFLPDMIQLFGRKLERVAGLYTCLAGLALYAVVLRLRLK